MDVKRISALLMIVSIVTACADSTNQKKSKSPARLAVQSSDLTEETNPQYLACAQETCGKATDLPFVTAPHQAIDQQYYQQYIQASLEKYIRLQQNSLVQKNQVVGKFSDMQIDHISDAYLVFLNFSYFFRFSEPVSKSLDITSAGIKVDISSLKQELRKTGLTDPQQVNWIILIARTMYESQLFYENYYLSQFPLEIFVKKAYPGMPLLAAIASEAKKLSQIQARVTEVYPVLKANSAASTALFEKAMRQEPLAPDEKQDFIENRMSFLSFQELLPGGRWRGFFLQRPVNIKSLATELIEKAKKSALAKATYSSLNDEAASLNVICSFYFKSRIASSPTPEQNLRFSNLIQNLKIDAKTVIERSRYTTSEIQNAIDNISIMLPPTKQEAAVALARSLNNEMAATLTTQETLSHLDIKNQNDKELVLLLLAGQYQDDSKDETPMSGVKKYCEKNLPETISDASYSAYQKINLGWRSVLYPQYGYGIASHEMGHVISTADGITDHPVFTGVKNCLVQNQNGEEKFIEEDFADVFAVQMMKMRPQGNYSCLLLGQENSEYTDLKISAAAGDNHSSGFYRLLAIGTQLNSLTPTCRAVSQGSPQGQRIKNCWGF